MYLALSQQHMYPWDQDVGGNCNMREKMDECAVFFHEIYKILITYMQWDDLFTNPMKSNLCTFYLQ